jgi:hypothetical protein
MVKDEITIQDIYFSERRGSTVLEYNTSSTVDYKQARASELENEGVRDELMNVIICAD